MSSPAAKDASVPGDVQAAQRWWVLAVIAACQLLVVLSASVVNIALPQAQRALSISDADRAWVVTAYTLGVGGLLLLGGRIVDYAGRKRVLIGGLVGFAGASAVGGAALNAPMLLLGRGTQGVFAALVTPAALSLLSVTFTEPRQRAIAFSVYGAMSGGGGAIGLVLGGVLTEYTSWRWCLLLNVPFALVTAAVGMLKLPGGGAAGPVHFDLPGALAVVFGLTLLVYALSSAGQHGWMSVPTIGLLIAALVLLAVFVVIEAFSRQPLLPLTIVRDPTRAGALLSVLLAGASLLGMFLFLTFYLQGTLGYSAVRAGLAFLPSSLGIFVGTYVTGRLLSRAAPRTLLTPGMALAGLGLWWLSRAKVSTSFWLLVAPAQLLVGVGIGLVFVTAASTALVGVRPGDAGIASALVSTAQQIGGSLGTALLNTVAAAATGAFLVAHPGAVEAAAVEGYRRAFLIGALLLGFGAVVSGVLIRAPRPDAALPA